MTKLLMIAAALTAFSAPAFAVNLTGTWTGSGQATDHQGKPINCESVVITIVQSASALKVDSAFSCEGSKIKIPGNMEVRGSDLFDKGAKTGTISANALQFVAKDKNYAMNTNASFTETSMNVGSVVSLASNPANPVLTFKATVKR